MEDTLDLNPYLSFRIHLSAPFHNPPATDLGPFDLLSAELLDLIIPHLDLATYHALRLVNRRALLLFTAHPFYHPLMTLFPIVLKAIHASQASQFTSLHRLRAALHTSSCATCDGSAPLIYLPTCTRVCVACLSRRPCYLPLGPVTASRNYGLPKRIVDSLPHCISVPGRYGPNSTWERRKLRLVDVRSAEEAAVANHGSLARMQRFVNHDRDLRWAVGSTYAGEEGVVR